VRSETEHEGVGAVAWRRPANPEEPWVLSKHVNGRAWMWAIAAFVAPSASDSTIRARGTTAVFPADPPRSGQQQPPR
jgi:hypothetical protein